MGKKSPPAPIIPPASKVADAVDRKELDKSTAEDIQRAVVAKTSTVKGKSAPQASVPNAGQEVTDWIVKRVGVTSLSDCVNYGFYEDGELVGGVAFYEYRVQDIVFSGVMEKGGFNRTMLRTLIKLS